MARATREFVASDEDAGVRLDAVVSRRTGVSRAVAARLIDSGDVLVGGEAAPKSSRVAAGSTITVAMPEPARPLEPEDLPVQVVYEDEALMVIAKAAGVVVHPAPGHEGGTLVNALLRLGAAGGEPARPGIVHRLDAGTSGLMVVARGEEAHAALVRAMAAREVTRVYLGLVEGNPDTDTFTVDAPIGRSPRHRKRMAVVADGREALTRFAVLERHRASALVEARPHTGRTHQIRVHLLAAGHPVAGDRVYGRDRTLAAALGLDRPFLHAAHLSFVHPLTGEEMAFEDPLPDDLEAALGRARDLP